MAVPGVHGGAPRGSDDPLEPAEEEEEEFDPLDPDALWTPSQKALPPVLGRYDKDTGERLMHYSDDVIQNPNKDEEFDWTDSEGTSIDIGF
ncbi:MAG: hypothetical protein ACRDXX_04175 [Stackebrandtia sp.]